MTILATILCGLCLLVAPIDALAQGPLAWEIEEFQGRLGGMALSDGALVVSGWAGGVNRQDLVVQAVKRGAGALLWSDRDASTPFCRTGELPLLVAGTQDMAFVVANQAVEGVGDAACRILVRAYDVPTGARLWEQLAETGSTQPNGVAASRSAIVVVGNYYKQTGDDVAFVRAYNPATGAPLWEDLIGSTGSVVHGWAVAISGGQVFVGGDTTPQGNLTSHALLLRAYDASSGKLNWETTMANASVSSLTVSAGRVFVASVAPPAFLAAFRVKTGGLLWQDSLEARGILNLAASGEHLVVVGYCLEGVPLSSPFVRAYEARTGTVDWEDCSPAHATSDIPFDGVSDRLYDVKLGPTTVYVAGRTSLFREARTIYSDLIARAYSASNGVRLWEDRSHAVNDASSGGTVSLALGSARLFMASNDADVVIRAYDIRSDATPSPDGTRVPPAPRIIDNSLAVWTIGPAFETLRNGIQVGGGYGTEYLWFGGELYVLGDDGNWWRWSGGEWTFASTSDPALPAQANRVEFASEEPLNSGSCDSAFTPGVSGYVTPGVSLLTRPPGCRRRPASTAS